MGRKIPAKKHRGVKDPEKQRAQRWAELKTKVNNPPTNDDQTIPKSLERIIKLKEDLKSGRIGVSKRKKSSKLKDKLIKVGGGGAPLDPKAKPEKAVPVFHQRPNERPHAFMNRVSRETHNFINETAFEKKYNVQVKRNPETGTIEGLENKAKDEIDELMKLQQKHKNIGKKKKAKTNEVKLSKSQKRSRKLEVKKAAKLQENIDEFKTFREEIKFGDVAHAPPDLRIKPARIEKLKVKSGKKDLLLNSLLNPSPTSKTTTPIDRTGKRKNLPSAERRMLEKQRSEIVNAYRQLKAK